MIMTYYQIKKLCGLEPEADWPKKLTVTFNQWEQLDWTLRDLETAEIYLQRIGYVITATVNEMDGSRRMVMVRQSGDHLVDPADLLRRAIERFGYEKDNEEKGILFPGTWTLIDEIKLWLAGSK